MSTLHIVPLPASAAVIAARITDDTERELWVRLYHARSAYDAAEDGALHHAYDADEADRRYAAVQYSYERAATDLRNYRRNR